MTGDRWTGSVTRMLAPNPGPMTLDGTNSYVIAAPGASGVVVVDPGPDDAGHLDALAAAGEAALVLLTHRHGDHVEGVDGLVARTGAPVRAASADLCRDAEPLRDGEVIRLGDAALQVLATPGHTDDSVCFLLTGAGEAPVMLTGDTILGRGTTVILPPDGSLADYFVTLDVLEAQGPIPALPGHGPMLDDLAAVCARYRAHREERLDGVRAVLADLGAQPADEPGLVTAVVDRLYADVDASIRFAAEASTRAQLAYLAASTGR